MSPILGGIKNLFFLGLISDVLLYAQESMHLIVRITGNRKCSKALAELCVDNML